MIPCDYKTKFNSSDYGDSDYDEDDDEGFVFDFVSSTKNNSKQSYSAYGLDKDNKQTVLTQSNSNSDNDNNKILIEVNNNYYCDDMEYLLDDLKSAILNMNYERVVNLFEKHNLDVNSILKLNWTPLMYAVSCGSFEITKYLVDKGADVNFDDDSFSVLLCTCGCTSPIASEQTLAKIVELIVSKGADVNCADKYYQTPLMYASRAGNLSLIECLVKLNADINAKDDNDWTSLAHASSKGHLKCVNKLLKLGADPTIYTSEYQYPFDLAEKSGHNDVKLLIKRYLRVQKLEKIKNSNDGPVCTYFDEDDDDFEDEEEDAIIFGKKKTQIDDLESFLNALKLSNLVKLFKTNNITLKKLLNLKEPDLEKIGVIDGLVRQLILNEIRNFHLKSWKANSLVPVRQDCFLNCNEVIALVANLSRHVDYMSANVKFVSVDTITNPNTNLFADKFLSVKLFNELKQAVSNTKTFLNELDSFCSSVQQKVKVSNAEPIDSIDNKSKEKKWLKNPLKITLISSIGFACAAVSTFYAIKKKLF